MRNLYERRLVIPCAGFATVAVAHEIEIIRILDNNFDERRVRIFLRFKLNSN